LKKDESNSTILVYTAACTSDLEEQNIV